MNTQIVVSSVTGNTLKVAKAIFESLVNSNKVDKCALVKVEDYKNSDDFENVLVGFWLDSGHADIKALEVIKSLKDKNVGIFGTLGGRPDSKGAFEVMQKTCESLDKSNVLLGNMFIQGKVNSEVLERMYVAFPHLKVTLLDSLNKRIKFLNTVINELDLEDITTIHGRAEDFARNEEYREQYDMVVSRAVANLAVLSEYCIPYVKMDGYFIPYKSGEIEDELNESKKAIKILGGKTQKVVQFELPDTDIARSLVIIKKEKSTGMKYPRKSGIPSRKPLH